MTFSIELVDPLTAAATAARILRTAWKPPCLDYSSQYLAWQFAFPGQLEPTVVVGFADGQPVGCAGVTQRTFAFDGRHVDAYVLSFVGVDPVARGRGLAAALYAQLLKALPADVPVIAFAEPGSAGERLLLNAFHRGSFTRHTLSACRAVGYIARPAATMGDCSAAPIQLYEEFISVVPPRDQETIWTRPTSEQWAHYAADPRPRVSIVLRDRNGVAIGTAMIVMTDMLSAQGSLRVPMLEGVCVPSQSADGVRAAFNFAAQHYGVDTTVIASNLSYLDSAVVKRAGARALPSSFNAYVFLGARTHSLQNAAHLNLEVI